VLSQSGRDECLAEANGTVLTVHRWRGDDRRVLVMNLGARAVELGPALANLRLRNARRLLTSSVEVDERLPPGTAAIFAGEGDLVGLLEGRP
jgi:hypothetical protein